MIEEMKQTIEGTYGNLSMTENGALGYISTGSKLVDLNFRLQSMRNGLSSSDVCDFISAMNDNLLYAVKWMFFVRDVREGVGERSVFIELYKLFYEKYPEQAIRCLDYISEYGRYKDVVDIAFNCDSALKEKCFEIIKNQLMEDAKNFTDGKGISLLAKWMPSVNATSKARMRAKEIAKYLGVNFCEYRKMLSRFRAYLDVTEVKTCANKWGEIDYNKVSSRANLKYTNAFIKHDCTRRMEYLRNVLNHTNGAKMNASVLYPHEIWGKYCNGNYWGEISNVDDSLEALWNNLKDMGDCGNTLVVCDGSGSMTCHVNGVMPLYIARSLGVYFAERCTGEFHNNIIEFSSRPKLINIGHCNNLAEKITEMNLHSDCSNTDIERTFMLILDTAVKNNMPQEDMPERVLVISDMEFDGATNDYGRNYKTLFEELRERFEIHGYKLPKMVFWNVASRTNTIPVIENDFGVILVSGFSVNILKMVLSNETNPWLAMKQILDSERYSVFDFLSKEDEA